MRKLGPSIRGERGQALVIFALALVALLGMAALVLDVGSWFRAQRRLQAVADAAVLAGAQALPYDAGTANALALDYANKNGGPTPTVTFPSSDTIDVSVEEQAAGFFAKIFGLPFDSVTVGAHALAQARYVSQAFGVVPIVVTNMQPMLTGCGGACLGSSYPTTLKVNDDDTLGGGQMGLIDVRPDGDGSVTAEQIADWVTYGLDGLLEPNRYYYAAGSCKFSNQNFHEALDAKIASQEPLLFPVYDPTRSDTSTNPPRYWIVGFAAFVLIDYRLTGCGNQNDFLEGYFVRYITQGISNESATPDFGVRIVSLIG